MSIRLRYKNYLRYEDTGVIEIPKGFSLIVGQFVSDPTKSNGTGKTGLVQGPNWAVWGEARTTKEMPAGDGLIRRPAKGRTMTIDFEYDGVRFSRKRKFGKTTDLEMRIKQELVTGKVAQVQEAIDRIVGISYQTFARTFYIPAGGDDLFINLSSTEAKKEVSRMLNLQVWAEYLKSISNDLTVVDNEIVGAQSNMAMVQGMIDEHDEEAEIEKSINNAKNKYAEIKIEIEGFVQEIDVLNVKRAKVEAAVGVIVDRIKEIEKHNEKVNDFTVLLDEAINSKKKIEYEIDKKKQEVDEISDLMSKIKRESIDIAPEDYDDYVSGVKKCVGEINELKEQKHKLDDSFDIVDGYHRQMEQTIKIIKSGNIPCPVVVKCPVFATDEFADYAEGLLKKYSVRSMGYTKALTKLREAIAKKIYEIDVVGDKKIEFEIAIEEYDEAIKANEKSEQQIENLTGRKESLMEMIGVLNGTLDSTYSEIERLKGEIAIIENHKIDGLEEKLKEKYTEINGIDSEIIKINYRVEQLNSDLDTANNNINKLTISLETLYELKNKLNRMRVDMVSLDYKHQLYKTIRSAFHVDGVPTYIISSLAAEIELIANSILEMADHDSRIFIQLRADTKTKDPVTGQLKQKDVFRIGVTNIIDGEQSQYASNSSGEGFWIDFAIRVALGIATRNRSKLLFNMLVIDEGLGVLDAASRPKFIDVIRSIIEMYGIDYVWLITHTSLLNMMGAFDNIIKCCRGDNKSWIEVN
jgi:DNA repair exonuclease SbcCD ATPase subunit